MPAVRVEFETPARGRPNEESEPKLFFEEL
jgi:hypothetical protein